MKLSEHTRKITIEIICLLYIVLFVYAAVSKLLDFENFQVQLGQSPLLSAFAGWVSWGVPIVEILIAITLLFPKCRLVGLFAAFSLMVLFSSYIIIILNFSSFVPCSCGGILEKMSWTQHLVFNVVFVILAAAGILILAGSVSKERRISKPAVLANVFFITTFCSVVFVGGLFLTSEDIIHNRNNFIRRFPHHPAKLIHTLNLEYNSYYISGIGNGKIYLGNSTSPLTVTVFDTTFQQKNVYKIEVPDLERTHHSLKVNIKIPYFYLSDGTSSFVYRGSVNDWNAKIWLDGLAYFNAFEPINDSKAAIRALSSSTHENVLGLVIIGDTAKLILNNQLLVKQIDGVFDTSGVLNYNEQLDKLIYTYSYRNEFIITDTQLQNKESGNTIDTTTRADIKVKYISSLRGSKISSPSRTINKATATFGNYLFVKSGLIGRYEPKDMWDEASIVDVYDIRTKSYAFSFYVYDKGNKKMTQFRVDGDQLFAIVGNYLTVYKFESDVFSNGSEEVRK